jgi:PAS domain S-box-containing protein
MAGSNRDITERKRLELEAAAMELSEYLLETLRQDGEFILYRGQHRSQRDRGLPSLLVVALVSERPAPGSLRRLEHAYSLRAELDPAWAVRPLALARHEGRTMLVLEDPGGEALDRLLGPPMEVGTFLGLAIGIAVALGKVHQRGLIHKDLKPANILVARATGEVRLSGFGLASRLPREHPAPEPPEVIAGTLAYMAPEQTGRMNRSVDARSDLYALGVTLYQMLTGVLPFTAADPMELVHCHLARRPVPPAERVPSLSPAISALVMTLLAKTPEDRYQTAAGVAADLRHCLSEWEKTGSIEPFPLGANDVPDVLRIPETLYGREPEVCALRAAFERVVSRGMPALVLVSGYSGIGKSAVVHELHKAIVPPRGLFASGKFDQYQRDIPYATLAQAFQALVRQLLVKREEELTTWRQALVAALGPNGRLVVDLVPELELLIGPQPPVPELAPREAENRFLTVLEGFLGVFARPEHPLVLFLDDLQWLDAATLKFLAHVVSPPKTGHLLAIGAYRDNEVGPAHPLMLTLESVRKAGARVEDIGLGPLSRDDLCRLVAASVGCGPSQAEPLGRLVHEKTAGNPFFAIQFLTALWEERLLAFDAVHGAWTWDIDAIRAQGFTDNVVELMVGKLRRLPAVTQEALQQFACLGNSADVATLTMVQSGTEEAVHAALWEAVRDGIVLRRGDAYRFLHDRVQEAAYALIPEDRRSEAHVRIGRVLLAHRPPEAVNQRVFDIVNQLNRGVGLIIDPGEKEKLRQLNALAGRRAKNAIAYASARHYLTQATTLLPADAWSHRYEETFALQLERTECEYLCGDFDVAEGLCKQLLEKARHALDAAKVYRLRMEVYLVSGRPGDAVTAAVEALKLFGVRFPDAEDDIRAATEAELRQIPVNLGDRRIADVVDAPPAIDPEIRTIIGLLAGGLAPSYNARPLLWPLFIAKAVNLSLKHGNTEESCYPYICYARILVALFEDIASGYAFSEMAVRLNEKFNDPKLKGRILLGHGAGVALWRKPLETTIAILRESFSACLGVGDLAYAGRAPFHIVWQMMEKGDRVNVLLDELDTYVSFAWQSYNPLLHAMLSIVRAFLTRLSGREDAGDDWCEEGQWLHILQDANYRWVVAMHHTVGLVEAFTFGRIGEALDCADKAESLRTSLLVMAYEFTCTFYSALTLTAAYPQADAARRQRWAQTLDRQLAKLRVWAEACPETFGNRLTLVMAELARIDGRDLEAMRLYEQAIRLAREHGFVQNEALANELAGRFYLDRGLEKNGYAHLRDAHACYALWGADGKVRHLERLYPRLAAPDRATATSGSPVQQLDVTAVVRASQAVSSEIVFPKLIETLMTIALQNAGADRGLLILPHAEAYRIAAEARAHGDTVEVMLCQASIEGPASPEALLRYVIRMQKSVILDDASKPSLFSEDEYLRRQQPRSILCLPLVRQGRLAGLLYLENTLTSHAFTPERVALLELLAAQAAISLENTRLYSELQEREAKIVRLVDANIIGIVIFDFEGRIIEANDAFLEMMGYGRDDLVSGRMRWIEMTPAEWLAVSHRAVAQMRATGSCEPFEKEYFRKDGSRVPVLVGAAAFEGSRNEGVAFVVDLTERKRAEEALRKSERQFHALFDEAAIGMALVNAAGHAFESNRTLQQLLGFSAEELRDMPFTQITHPDDVPLDWHLFTELVRGHRDQYQLEKRYHRKDGTLVWGNLTVSLVRDERGEPLFGIAMVEDSTERKRAEEALRQTQAALAHLSRVMTMGALTASIAHEVNQPLAGVVTNGNACLRWLARAEPDLEEARAAVERIIRDGQRASTVIRRMRALAQRTDPQTAWLDLNDVIHEVIVLVHSEVRTHRVVLRTDLSAALPPVLGDRIQLQQVLLNLLINGIEAMYPVTDRTREVRIRSQRYEADTVLVAVQDAGIGLDPENMARLFDAFFTTKPGGMGIGLAISRTIIEAHGGRLWATPHDGPGATVQFTLPAGSERVS